MKIYRATNIVSGEIREGLVSEVAEAIGRSKNATRDAARVGGLMKETWRMSELGECEDFPDHVERLGLRRVCPSCGKEFIAGRLNQTSCSRECSGRSFKKRHPEKCRLLGKPKVVAPIPVVAKPGMSAAEIDRMAKAVGTSYGIYVALNGL